jgi:ABC-2 type transport system permease protein
MLLLQLLLHAPRLSFLYLLASLIFHSITSKHGEENSFLFHASISYGGGFTQYLSSVSVPFYLLFLVYFLLGFFLYATMYAGLGALVKRQDEVQSAVVLPMLLLISGFALIYLAVYFPNSTWVKVLSFIPFWTPTLMLVRIALGSVAWWDIALTIVLMLVTICVCALFSVRIYRFGVLMYGQKPGPGQLVKMVRMK